MAASSLKLLPMEWYIRYKSIQLSLEILAAFKELAKNPAQHANKMGFIT